MKVSPIFLKNCAQGQLVKYYMSRITHSGNLEHETFFGVVHKFHSLPVLLINDDLSCHSDHIIIFHQRCWLFIFVGCPPRQDIVSSDVSAAVSLWKQLATWSVLWRNSIWNEISRDKKFQRYTWDWEPIERCMPLSPSVRLPETHSLKGIFQENKSF